MAFKTTIEHVGTDEAKVEKFDKLEQSGAALAVKIGLRDVALISVLNRAIKRGTKWDEELFCRLVITTLEEVGKELYSSKNHIAKLTLLALASYFNDKGDLSKLLEWFISAMPDNLEAGAKRELYEATNKLYDELMAKLVS